MVTLAVIGIVYGALVSMVQPDLKRVVAYSSVSHLGFVMLGIWAGTVQSVQGSIMVMIAHGISTGALFFLVGMLYERRHTRMIADFGGLARVAPLLAAAFTITAFSSIGLPGLNGFVGEFLVLLGSFGRFPVATVIATTVVIFAAAYLLWAVQRVFFNPLSKPENERVPDLNLREVAVMVPLIAAMLWMGLYPQPILRRTEAAAARYVETIRPYLPVEELGAPSEPQTAAAEVRP
jgi:NADH-quinone oxidoreductase subunit M